MRRPDIKSFTGEKVIRNCGFAIIASKIPIPVCQRDQLGTVVGTMRAALSTVVPIWLGSQSGPRVCDLP
jgi:hypothetical protein